MVGVVIESESPMEKPSMEIMMKNFLYWNGQNSIVKPNGDSLNSYRWYLTFGQMSDQKCLDYGFGNSWNLKMTYFKTYFIPAKVLETIYSPLIKFGTQSLPRKRLGPKFREWNRE